MHLRFKSRTLKKEMKGKSYTERNGFSCCNLRESVKNLLIADRLAEGEGGQPPQKIGFLGDLKPKGHLYYIYTILDVLCR